MTKLHTAAAVLLSAAILLGGCAAQPENSDQSSNQSSLSDQLSDQSNISDTSSDNSSSAPKPDIELTDLELQAILKDLTANAIEIDSIFTRLSDRGEGYPLKVNDIDYSGTYYPIAENRKTEPQGSFTVPQTSSELEQLLLTCFTRRAVKYYMDDIGAGHTMIDTDGKTVLIEDQKVLGQKRFIEVDGMLYRESGESDNIKLDIDCTTAKVTSKTEKTIKFTYSSSNGTLSETEGVIVLEDGGWKFDFFHGKFIPELPTEFTEEDKELHNILNELSAGEDLYLWFYRGAFLSRGGIFKNSNDPNSYGSEYSLLPKGEKSPYYGLEYPQSCEQVEEMLLKYFTLKTADKFMRSVGKGTMTENPDGTYAVTTETGWLPIFLEIDGKMYLRDQAIGGPDIPIWNTAQITERTSDSIKFTIIHAMYEAYYPKNGLIKYERGGWKLNFDMDGFDAEDKPAE